MNRFFSITLLFLTAFLLLATSAQANIVNLLGNTSFENNFGGSGNWDNTANRGISNPAIAGAPAGRNVLRLDESTTVAGGFVGVFTFQLLTGINPNDQVAFSGLVRANTLAAGEEAQLRIEFQNSAGTLISANNVSLSTTSASFRRISVGAAAPNGTSQVAFVIRIQPATAGGTSQVDFDDVKGSFNSFPIVINATSQAEVRNPGDLTMISTSLQNVSADVLGPIEVEAKANGGISINPEQAYLDGKQVAQREGSVIFNVGNLAGGQESLFAFAALLNSGAIPGKRYEITLVARNGSGVALSDTVHIVIIVEPDPLFHLGTIIGKVFNDLNHNGVQDPGEKGIPNVRIATEQGVVVYTDAYGKYHIPQVLPGRHVVKVDWHSLPEGTQFVTEESYLAKITEGLLAKVNFAVKLPEDDMPEEYHDNLMMSVIQELDRINPELSMEMDPSVLKAGKGLLEREVHFRLHTNYGNLIKEWRIDVRDEMGQEVWTGIGKGAPPQEVHWNGKDNAGNLLEVGDYAVRLIVTDSKDREDWAPLQFFRVETKVETWKNSSSFKPFSSVGYFNMAKDGKRSIPLTGRTAVRVQGKTPSKNKLLVNQQIVSVREDGSFETAMFLPDGTQKIEVTTTAENGESLSVQKEVKIKDNYMFMVGLGEEELGRNSFTGNIETIKAEDRFRDGFYQDGRVSYYLKGKIKGKFLITSSYDSKNTKRRSKLFNNIDPDKYYPVYGDGSQVDYSASETQGPFFILIEKDKSFLKWGSFNTDFTDTELTRHNRTGSGGKVHFETLGTTRYGDSKAGFSVFHTEQKQLPDHNEFSGTGGSLYYLRKRFVVEGSEKIRVEVRDKFTNMVLSRKELVSGTGYEIDYDQGRIILKKPLSSVAISDTVINQGLLEGQTNVLTVDYEYKESQVLGYGTSGLRGFQHFSDFVRVGGTYVEDKHPPNADNYTLRGVDTQIRLSPNTRITGEYAQSENPQLEGFSSTNGGLSFSNFHSANRSSSSQGRNEAYVIRVESKPFKKLDVSGYVQKYNPFFSNADTVFSQGDMKKYGAEVAYHVTNNFTLRYRKDHLHLEKKNLATATDIDSGHFDTAQAVFDDEKILTLLEYRHSNVKIPEASRLTNSLFATNNFDDAVGTKIGYHLTEKYMPYIRGQVTVNQTGKSNNQAGVGLEAKVLDKSTVAVEQNFGNLGDSTQIRFETRNTETATTYATIARGNEKDYGEGIKTTLGSSHVLDDRSRLFSEKEYSGYRGSNYARNILGYERTFFDDRLGGIFTVERNEQDQMGGSGIAFLGNPVHNAYSAAFNYKEGDFLEAGSKLEFRRVSEATASDRQWLSYNNLGIKITKDLEFFGRFNFSKTRDLDRSNSLADFVELNTGFSFRPVEWDRFNALTRYTFLDDHQPVDRFGTGVVVEDTAHIVALEGAYDFNRYLGWVEKLAFKLSQLKSGIAGAIDVYNYLWVNRINFHITRKWDLGSEYRVLTQQGAGQTLKQGVLIELDRELFDYTRIGVGYNFTDFEDDLRKTNSYRSSSQGPFIRLTGKF